MNYMASDMYDYFFDDGFGIMGQKDVVCFRLGL